MNTFGKNITLTTFGESHGPAMGGILDGMPSCVSIDTARVQQELDRRAPGRQANTSTRREPDRVEFLSGLLPCNCDEDKGDGQEGKYVTLGSPIGFIIRNHDVRREDYAGYVGKIRPNHADYTYYKKYGIHDFSGGGRSSARETVSWVVAGALCRQWLEQFGIEVKATFVETNSVADVASEGDSTGGIVECVITGMMAGFGSPVFDKLHARLAAAMMGINAAKGFEYGDGFKMAYARGSEVMDIPVKGEDGEITFSSNHSGGIQGGISNGMPINFRVYFKPTPTLMREIETLDVNGNPVVIPPKGRHDPCVAIRAVAIVEAMALLVLADVMR